MGKTKKIRAVFPAFVVAAAFLCACGPSVSPEDQEFNQYVNMTREADSPDARIRYSTLALDLCTAKRGNKIRSELLASRAMGYQQKDQLRQALEDLDVAIHLDPNNAELYSNRGKLFSDMGDYAKAQEEIEYALKMDSKIPHAHLNLGLNCERQKNFECAYSQYAETMKLKPDFAQAYVLRGKLLAQMGDNAAALADFGDVLKLQPKSSEAHYERALLYAQSGYVNEAINDLTVSIQNERGDEKARFMRAYYYFRLKRYAESKDDLTAILKLNTDNKKARMLRGYVLLCDGNPRAARFDFENLVDTADNISLASLGLALAYYKEGFPDYAVFNYRRAVRVAPYFAQPAKKLAADTKYFYLANFASELAAIQSAARADSGVNPDEVGRKVRISKE